MQTIYGHLLKLLMKMEKVSSQAKKEENNLHKLPLHIRAALQNDNCAV